MNTHPTPPARGRQHPLLILAALAVILFCAVGTAAIMGWLPSSKGRTTSNELNAADRAALSASMQQPGVAGPGVAAPGSMAPVAPPPVYPAQAVAGSYAPAPAAPLPAAPAASTYAPGYVAPGYAGQGSTAYGNSVQGASASGYDEPAPVRESHPKARTTTRLANEDASSRWCGTCGNVESVRTITTRAQGSGVGAAGGAILGGLLGNQIGSGHGRQLATVAGAVGGAVMGNQVEGNMKANHSYEIRVRLDDGTLRTFHQQSVPQWRTGDRVRIVKGSLRAA